MSKKVLIVAATLAGGGAERVFVNLANKMEEKGLEVRILVTAQRPADYIVTKNIKIISINTQFSNKIFKIYQKLKQIREILKEHKEYTVISYMPDVCAYVAVASIGIKNRVIMSERSAPMCNPDYRYMRIIRDVAYCFADVCVFQSYGAKQYFRKSIQKKGIVILNPISANLLPKDLEKKENVIMAVGRLAPSKNISMLIEAYQKFHREYPEYIVRIYGRGKEEELLKQKVHDEGLEQYILFEGYAHDIYQKMQTAAIYVSTSNYEGLSNTMLEAMAMGVPTIVTDCPSGGASMIIKSGENGLLVPVGDAKALSEAMEEVISNFELRQKITKNSMNVRGMCDIEKITNEWIKIL